MFRLRESVGSRSFSKGHEPRPSPGSANLPIGVLQIAIQENGVPGKNSRSTCEVGGEKLRNKPNELNGQTLRMRQAEGFDNGIMNGGAHCGDLVARARGINTVGEKNDE